MNFVDVANYIDLIIYDFRESNKLPKYISKHRNRQNLLPKLQTLKRCYLESYLLNLSSNHKTISKNKKTYTKFR